MPRLVAFAGLSLRDDEGPLGGRVAGSRNLALLVLLARAGESGMTRDRLAAFLWPESDAERARHSLDQALYTVRRALGVGVVVANGATLSLDRRRLASDVAEFEDAIAGGAPGEAIALYHGPFLDGFHVRGSASFERWVDGERATLHRRYTATLESLATEAANAGDHSKEVEFRRLHAEAEPLSSRVVLDLMRALAAAGDRAGALRASAEHERLVREELEAVPDPAILELADSLRSEPDRRRPARTPAPRAAPAGADVTVPESGRTGWSRRRGVALLAIAAIGLAAAFGLASVDRGTDEAMPAVAVVAFDNETGDSSVTALGRMAADWIADGLMRTGLVRVLSDADRAGVSSVVSGSVFRAGDSLWFRVRISRPSDGTMLRAPGAVGTSVATPTQALEPLRQRVLGALGTLYDARLAAWPGTALNPPSFDAYREFAAGMDAFSMPRDLDEAEARFRRAATLDSTFLLPRLWLAWVALQADDYERAGPIVEALRPDRDRMSPLESAWYDRIAAVLAGDNEAAFTAAERMVAIAPDTGWRLALASAALDTNRPGTAIATLRERPFDGFGAEQCFAWFLLTAAYHQAGEYERELKATNDAIQTCGLAWGFTGPGVGALAALGRFEDLEQRLDEMRGVSLEQGRPGAETSLLTAVTELRAHGFPAEATALIASRAGPDGDAPPDASTPGGWIRLQLLYEVGRWADAARIIDVVPAPHRPPRLRAMAALIAARTGDAATARTIAGDLASETTGLAPGEAEWWQGRIEAALGNGARSVALLRQAFASGQGAPARYELHVLRDFDSLRDLPAFRDLVTPRN